MVAQPPAAGSRSGAAPGSGPGSTSSSASGAAFGARLRAARVAAGISLRELARRLGVTPSLLSQVERDLAQPSVGTLWAVVSELGISLDALFAADGEAPAPGPAARTMVQRAGDRVALDLEGGVRWERLTPVPDPGVVFAFVTYPPGRTSDATRPVARHRGTEYGYLISGRLAVEVGGEAIELGPGDSIVFASDTPHRFRALGAEPTCAVWWNLAR
jgi:transcriptional regulator with XRE-family HTH domain